MNQTQLRGFVKPVESAYSFVATQVKTEIKLQLKKKRQHRATLKRLTTSALTAALVLSINLSELKAYDELQVVPVQAPAFETQVKLDTTSYSLLVIESPKVEIKPGKSLAQTQADKARVRVTSSATIVKVSTDQAHQMAREAANKAGIADHWKVLTAIWQVESGKAVYSCIVSKADGRAVGPMQFMPGTFRAYKPFANADICNAHDALQAAANLLKRGGIDNGNVDGAIHNYNHSMAYVKKVKQIANSIN